jgi:hypothetical protein
MMLRTFLFPSFFGLLPFMLASQNILEFPVNSIGEMISKGTCSVTHSTFDIGSIQDVFDHNDNSLARSQSINPLTITLTFPFAVSFEGSNILQTYGDGWWTVEAADTEYDLAYETGSYVRLIDMSSLLDGIPDEITFSPVSKKIIRLTVRRTTGDDYVHLNEWQLVNGQAEVEIVSTCIRPSEMWLLPGKKNEVILTGYDATGLTFPITENVDWMVSGSLVTVDQTEDKVVILAEQTLGAGQVTASWNDLHYSIPVNVVDDFKPLPAEQRIVNVALVIIDPPIAAEGGMRFHERFGWTDPHVLADLLADSLNAMSKGVVDYQITNTYDEPVLYAMLEGHVISVDSMYRLFLEPGWETFHYLEQIGGYAFDYNGLLEAHDFCTLSNENEIDEVWVYSMPFTGMYESRLTGNGAFWYNSPPLDGNDCIDQLPIMGFNYERGLTEAMHSFGHRVESAMAHAFGRWDYTAEKKNDWELFSSYDLVAPGEAHVGNIHFPPNGLNDYDYVQFFPVLSQEGNWFHYPFLFDVSYYVGPKQWDHSEHGYMSWWFRHLPSFNCVNRYGILNNWWAYIVDCNEAKQQELDFTDCHCQYTTQDITATSDPIAFTMSVFPNPASSGFHIHTEGSWPLRYSITDINGKIVTDGLIESGYHLIQHNLPQGMYFIRLIDEKGNYRSMKIIAY